MKRQFKRVWAILLTISMLLSCFVVLDTTAYAVGETPVVLTGPDVVENFTSPITFHDGMQFGKDGMLTMETSGSPTFNSMNGNYLDAATPTKADAYIIRSTNPLPQTYKVSVDIGCIDYELLNSADEENGMYFAAIMSALPQPTTNEWFHANRKIIFDTDNNSGNSGGSHPIFMGYYDTTGQEYFYNGSTDSWASKYHWDSAANYDPTKWYTFEVEKTSASYIATVSDAITHTVIKSFTIPVASVKGSSLPDYLLIGDPHTNYYNGSAKIANIRIEDTTTTPSVTSPDVMTGPDVVENFSSPVAFTDGGMFGQDSALTMKMTGTPTLDTTSGKYLDVANKVDDTYLICSTNQLPDKYKISVDVGDINYPHSSLSTENGMSFITITNQSPTKDSFGGNRKITFDTDDNSDGNGGALPVFAGYFNPSSESDWGTFYQGSSDSWTGSWDSIINYDPSKWYTFELEKTDTEYIYTISDAITHNLIKSVSTSIDNVGGKTEPDYFCLGDPFDSCFVGSAKIANIRIKNNSTEPTTPPAIESPDVMTGPDVVENFSSSINFADDMQFGKNNALTLETSGTPELNNLSGKYLDASSPERKDAYIIRSTNPLPSTYKVSVDIGHINYALKLGDEENGINFATIMSAVPQPGTDGWINDNRKIVFDTDDNTYDCGARLPIFTGYFNNSGESVFYKSSTDAWGEAGDWDSIMSYDPNKWYTFELEKTFSEYIFTISDAISHDVIKQVSVPSSEVGNPSLPEYLTIGDPYINYYEGDVKIANIRIKDTSTPTPTPTIIPTADPSGRPYANQPGEIPSVKMSYTSGVDNGLVWEGDELQGTVSVEGINKLGYGNVRLSFDTSKLKFVSCSLKDKDNLQYVSDGSDPNSTGILDMAFVKKNGKADVEGLGDDKSIDLFDVTFEAKVVTQNTDVACSLLTEDSKLERTSGSTVAPIWFDVSEIPTITIIQKIDIVNSKITLKDWVKDAKDMTIKLYKPDNSVEELVIDEYTYDAATALGTVKLKDFTDLTEGDYQLVVEGLGYTTSTATFTISKTTTQPTTINFEVTDFIAGDIVDGSTNNLGSDGKIDINDFNAACTFFKPGKAIDSSSQLNRASDLNRDGYVDISDVAYIINNWRE